ncbi:MAG: Glucose 1-dehydrogenase [Alphaproteobacteria bacterium MarineAlpha9_Bin3]|nr:MAG: Glucose 1-dehydrogenase [Alphaproteobacteria bacterium MarineAlpha9_Bin3]|tara:strand:+ start:3443 stop:4225 length:783 start_codon:yes stop_codon:yes gene_type:complete
MKPICLVIGAGAGIGGNTAHRFSKEGYHVALCRRSNQEALDNMVKDIEAKGGSASGYILNAIKEDTIENLVKDLEKNLGQIEVVIFNLGAQIGDVTLADLSYKQFELGWRMATFALFRTAYSVFPYMEKRHKGALIVTSSTASVRGNPRQHSHAAAMGGRRLLCQSLNAEFGPKGIHIAHIIVDGAVDAPDTLGKMLGPEKFQKLRETKGMEHDGLMLPEKIADTYFHIAQQQRSVWTHELDMRSFSDSPWWNDNNNSYI